MENSRRKAAKRYEVLIVTFTNGQTIKYTDKILPLLLTDKYVKTIINADTCEIIKG